MVDQRENGAGWRPCKWLHRYAIFVAFLTVILLLAGALVTSNEAGDSVPDWPLSFGRWLISSDDFVANARYEYSHRFIAGLVGASTFVLALWTQIAERRKWMRRLAIIAFGGVLMQAAVGGVRVLLAGSMPLGVVKPLISVPHALVAQSFFGLIVSIIVFTSRSWSSPKDVKRDEAGASLRKLTRWTVAAILIQLVLGAGFRHLAFGVLPHFIGALVVTSLIAWTALAVFKRHAKDSYLARPAIIAIGLLAAQLGLGVAAYIYRMASAGEPVSGVAQFFGSMTLASLEAFNQHQPVEPAITLSAAHLLVGALTLATMIVVMLRCHQVLAPESRKAVEISEQTLGSSPQRATV